MRHYLFDETDGLNPLQVTGLNALKILYDHYSERSRLAAEAVFRGISREESVVALDDLKECDDSLAGILRSARDIRKG